MSGIQAILAALWAQRDGLTFVVLSPHDDHAFMLLVDQKIRQRQVVGDDLHRFATHFAAKQERR
ncbi:hypothetical protein D3C81_2030360 [compost metagenome]